MSNSVGRDQAASRQPKPGLMMRYEVVEAAGSHVLLDLALGEFCTLPDPVGRPALLAFPDAYSARLWLMTADARRHDAAGAGRIRTEQREPPQPEPPDWLRFDLYVPVPAGPKTPPGPNRPPGPGPMPPGRQCGGRTLNTATAQGGAAMGKHGGGGGKDGPGKAGGGSGGGHSGAPDTAPHDGHRDAPPTNLPKPAK